MALVDILPDIVNGAGLNVKNLNVTSEEEEMKHLVSLMNQAGDDISRRAEWSKAFKTENIPANVQTHALPADFQRMIERGALSLKGGVFTPLRLVTDPASWQFLTGGTSVQTYCHIDNGDLLIYPGSGYAGATMKYISKNWLYSGVTGSTRVTSDNQTTIFPENLLISSVLWRWNRLVGLPFDDLAAEFEANFASAITADRGTK